MSKALGCCVDVIPGIVPVDLQDAQNGDYVSLKNAQGVLVLLFKGAGTAGDDPVLTFQQAEDVSGTNVKNLAVVTEHHQKQGTLTSVGAWTRVTQTASQTLSLNATSAENQGLYAIEIEADQLDVDNGFDCIRVNVGDVGGNAQIGGLLYVLHGLRYPAAPANLPSAIVD